MGVMMNFIQQFVGINFFALYSAKVFDEINNSGQLINVLLNVAAICSLIPVLIINAYSGRKFALISSDAVVGLMSVIIAIMIWTGWLTILYIPIIIYMLAFGWGLGGLNF